MVAGRIEHQLEGLAAADAVGGLGQDRVLVACARGADLFICDAICAASDGEQWAQRARNLMHPTAREAAELATRAGAGALTLVHIGRFGNPANIRDEASAGFRGPVSVPDDGARLTI